MVHTVKNKSLGRKAEARKALLVNQSNALIQKKRIITTLVKAKVLARFIAPIITKARNRSAVNIDHAYRQVFAILRNKYSTQTLFNEILPKVQTRPGGYTRIIKLSALQKGDGAQKALIELVDFNKLLQKAPKLKTRRGRSKKSSTHTPLANKQVEQPENVAQQTLPKEKRETTPKKTATPTVNEETKVTKPKKPLKEKS